MANFQRKFGSDKDNNKKQEPVTTGTPGDEVKAPSGVNKDVWAQAEHNALNQTGGFSGIGEEGKKKLIQEQYDQMVQNDKDLKAWAGEDSKILGDQ